MPIPASRFRLETDSNLYTRKEVMWSAFDYRAMGMGSGSGFYAIRHILNAIMHFWGIEKEKPERLSIDS